MEQIPFDTNRINDWRPHPSRNERKFRKLVKSIRRQDRTDASPLSFGQKIIRAHSLSRQNQNGEHTRLVEILSQDVVQTPSYISQVNSSELPSFEEGQRIMLEIRQQRNMQKRILMEQAAAGAALKAQANEADQNMRLEQGESFTGILDETYPMENLVPQELLLNDKECLQHGEAFIEAHEAAYGPSPALSYGDETDDISERDQPYFEAAERLIEELDRIAVLRSA